MVVVAVAAEEELEQLPVPSPLVKNFSMVSILMNRELVDTELATEVGLFSWISMTPSKISLRTGSEFKVSIAELRSPSLVTFPAPFEQEFEDDAIPEDDDEVLFGEGPAEEALG